MMETEELGDEIWEKGRILKNFSSLLAQTPLTDLAAEGYSTVASRGPREKNPVDNEKWFQ
jgi:hypothetical protein